MQATSKPVARIQRYEALMHRLITLELALHHVAMSKYGRGWELLVQVSRQRADLYVAVWLGVGIVGMAA